MMGEMCLAKSKRQTSMERGEVQYLLHIEGISEHPISSR
jgi:hypothetical protein